MQGLVADDQQAYVAAVMSRIKTAVQQVVADARATSTPLPAAKELAELLEAGLPRVRDGLDPYFARVGPFYDTAGAQLQLGQITKQAVANRRRDGSILAMQSGDGHWVYPAWQFTGQGALHRNLVPVLKALRGLDGWTAAVWLVNDHLDLGDRSPRTALADGVDPNVVTELATHDSSALLAP